MQLDKNKVLAVINRLKSVEVLASKEGMLDMDECKVRYNYHKNTCDAPHCVGGWYAIACKDEGVIHDLLIDNNCDYGDGSRLMARHLGFRNRCMLELYLENNPKIWGNIHGTALFSSERAYNYPNFKGVIEHWQDVYNRL